jgi:hypothetical protein
MINYTIVPWSADLDLTTFYKEASRRGFENNSSQKVMVDCFDNEVSKQIWLLYYKNEAIGSVAAHSFHEMGEDAYRIAARTCIFTDKMPGQYSKGLRTISVITEHQNPTSQFLIPTCINWAPTGSKIYITSNNSKMGSQRLVHRIFGPAMEKAGLMKNIREIEYRGTIQTVWQLFPDKFLENLKKFPKW